MHNFFLFSFFGWHIYAHILYGHSLLFSPQSMEFKNFLNILCPRDRTRRNFDPQLLSHWHGCCWQICEILSQVVLGGQSWRVQLRSWTTFRIPIVGDSTINSNIPSKPSTNKSYVYKMSQMSDDKLTFSRQIQIFDGVTIMIPMGRFLAWMPLLLLIMHSYIHWSNIGAIVYIDASIHWSNIEAISPYGCTNKQTCLTVCLVQETSSKRISYCC